MLFLGNVVDGVIGRQCYPVLGNNLATITDGRDPMDGHARLCFTRSLYGLMYVMAPHALTPILGQKRGMEVDDAARKGLDEEVGH